MGDAVPVIHGVLPPAELGPPSPFPVPSCGGPQDT